MNDTGDELPREHHDYVDSLSPEEKAVYDMSKVAGYNIIKRMDAEHHRGEAEYAASHDELTGLLNKAAWNAALFNRVHDSEITGRKLGILFIDLKDFKRANDRHGHKIGDQVIIYSAEVLKAALREKDRDYIARERFNQPGNDEAGRIGGDEFAVILDLTPRDDSELTPQESLSAVSNRIQEIFHSEPEIKNTGVDISIGGAIWEPGITADALLFQADQAMYEHKAAQKQQYGSYR